MVFSSVLFLFYFLPAALILYFITPKKFRNVTLFLVSLVFYAWGEPIYVLIMLFSTVFDFANGYLIDKYRKRKYLPKIILWIAIVGNLAILGFFKYADFIIGNINSIFGLSIPLLYLPLPIGISFYTFQTMSYSIDVYRGDAPVQKNIFAFGAYVALFPQLIAGPIVRYNTIAEQLVEREESYDKFASGISRFMTGLGKKVLLANNIGLLWDTVKVLPANELSFLTAWLGIIAMALQLYFDFSGYSDMAIGLGRMLGFEFMENFNYPYISKSISEFWRRWHISLGTWFKEYVYIPLGGNRVKLPRVFFNLLAVWFLTGLWHGANWNFVLWGLYFFVFIALEKAFLSKLLKKLPAFLRHCYALLIVITGMTFYAVESMPELFNYLKTLYGFGAGGFVDETFLYQFSSFLPVLLIAVIGCLPQPARWMQKFATGKRKVLIPVLALLVFFICTAYLVDSTYNPFLYFRF